MLQTIFPSWDPPSTEEEPCAICEIQIYESKEGKRELRKQAEDEKVNIAGDNSHGTRSLPISTGQIEAHVRFQPQHQPLRP